MLERFLDFHSLCCNIEGFVNHTQCTLSYWYAMNINFRHILLAYRAGLI